MHACVRAPCVVLFLAASLLAWVCSGLLAPGARRYETMRDCGFGVEFGGMLSVFSKDGVPISCSTAEGGCRTEESKDNSDRSQKARRAVSGIELEVFALCGVLKLLEVRGENLFVEWKFRGRVPLESRLDLAAC